MDDIIMLKLNDTPFVVHNANTFAWQNMYVGGTEAGISSKMNKNIEVTFDQSLSTEAHINDVSLCNSDTKIQLADRDLTQV